MPVEVDPKAGVGLFAPKIPPLPPPKALVVAGCPNRPVVVPAPVAGVVVGWPKAPPPPPPNALGPPPNAPKPVAGLAPPNTEL